MSTMLHRVASKTMPLELKGSPVVATKVSKIVLNLVTSASVGNRTPQLELRASSPQIYDVANWAKAALTALVAKLNADTGVTDTNYAASTTTAATTLATAYALLNDIKAKLNAVGTKLDSDAGVSMTAFAAQTAVGSADSTTPATAITLGNEILADLRAMCNMLDSDSAVVDLNYETTIMASVPTALTTSSTKDASAVTTASSTVVHTFSTGVSDGNGTGYVNTVITEYTIPIGACIAVNIKTPVDASGDLVSIDVEFHQ